MGFNSAFKGLTESSGMLLCRSQAVHKEYPVLQEYLIFMTLKIKAL